jgi:predicted RNase H-like nuclease
MAVWIAGVDGCPHGWVAAFLCLDGGEAPRVRIAAHMGEIVDGAEAPAIVVVDMPIGLPDRIAGSGRGPERLIRPLLGAANPLRSPSCRQAVHAPDYRSARAAALASSDPPRKVSARVHAVRKIRDRCAVAPAA